MNKKILNLSSDILGENTKIETNIFLPDLELLRWTLIKNSIIPKKN